MRSMSQDMLDRLKESQQTVYNNSNPSLKVLISRGLSKELFRVYTIENLESLGAIDVSARREVVENDPDLVYVVRIAGGVADILSHTLPYDPIIDWETEFTIGPATDVAIEHDGAWARNYGTKSYNFVTGTVPWVFHVLSGFLKAQLWDNVAIELATTVTRVVALRGWIPANGDESSDQGLIVAYLKTDGKMYYRAYCMQESGEKAWEVEHEVTAFTGTITDLALFRTNDFRVGFAAVIADNVWWSVTTRNWAGMSIWPETISATVKDVTAEVTEIFYLENDSHVENIIVTVPVVECYVCPAAFDVADVVITYARRVDDYHIKLVFSEKIINIEGAEDYFSLPVYNILDVVYGDSEYELMLLSEAALPKVGSYEVAYSGDWLRVYITDVCKQLLLVFSVTAMGDPPEHNEYLEASVTDVSITYTFISYLEGFGEENLTATVTDVSILLTHVGSNPL